MIFRAFKISNAADFAVVFTDGFFELDADPVAGGELNFTNESNHAIV
jgi:hypothetical protein